MGEVREERLPKSSIYMDYAATTPVHPKVLEQMLPYLSWQGKFGNAGSRSHRFGWEAEEGVEGARSQVADLLHADVREIIFTSGATESNNFALKGAAQMYAARGKHLITSEIEHKSVLDVMKYLEGCGYKVTYLKPNREGQISVRQLEEALTPETILVSLMWVNNELGTLNPIQELSRLCRERGVFMHTDATQALGKIPVDLSEVPVDLLSFSAHKIYGPKGVGGLFVRRNPKVRLAAQIHGGGQERGLRSGTLAVHQIVGLGAAATLAKEDQVGEARRLRGLKEKLLKGLLEIEEVSINGSLSESSPAILNLSFADVEGESLMMRMEGLAVSSGSACTSSTLAPSYVLRALGVPDELAHSSIRFSLGYWTQEADIEQAIYQVREAVHRLRAISPLWEMRQAGVKLSGLKWKT